MHDNEHTFALYAVEDVLIPPIVLVLEDAAGRGDPIWNVLHDSCARALHGRRHCVILGYDASNLSVPHDG